MEWTQWVSSTKSHSQQQTNEDISSQTEDESRCRQNNQHSEKWRVLCETLSLQFTVQSWIIVSMYWFSLNDVPECIALRFTKLLISLWSAVSLLPSLMLSIHFPLTPFCLCLSSQSLMKTVIPKWSMFLEKSYCIVIRQNTTGNYIIVNM